MAQLIEEVTGFYDVYPSWLVSVCLVVFCLGALWVCWKLIRFGLMVLVATALLAIVIFAGWMILAQ